MASEEEISRKELETALWDLADHNYEGLVDRGGTLLIAYNKGVVAVKTEAIEIANTSADAGANDTVQLQPRPAKTDI